MSITDVFLLASKFLPFKDIGTVSIFSLFSKLLAVQLLLIQLTNIVFSQVTSDMIWTEFLIYLFFFFTSVQHLILLTTLLFLCPFLLRWFLS